jgi:hypothetical protein
MERSARAARREDAASINPRSGHGTSCRANSSRHAFDKAASFVEIPRTVATYIALTLGMPSITAR